MYSDVKDYCSRYNVTLVVVSKTQPAEAIRRIYDLGQRIFGENRVQELAGKYEQLPKDIKWHLIGHLQKNKVKYIAPFVEMIHSVDSLELLMTIQKEALKNHRIIKVLLQYHIAQENTKYGLSEEEGNKLASFFQKENMSHVQICGVMGMATFTDDEAQIRREFQQLLSIFNHLKETVFYQDIYFKEISMGMSSDYKTAIEEGSTMVRVGSAVFSS